MQDYPGQLPPHVKPRTTAHRTTARKVVACQLVIRELRNGYFHGRKVVAPLKPIIRSASRVVGFYFHGRKVVATVFGIV